jgi:hypothetical protein
MRRIRLKYKDNFSIIFLRKWLLQGKVVESYMRRMKPAGFERSPAQSGI